MKTIERDDLNSWWNSLDLNALMKIFHCPAGQDANDFIDDCDTYWWGLSEGEKWDFYCRHAFEV